MFKFICKNCRTLLNSEKSKSSFRISTQELHFLRLSPFLSSSVETLNKSVPKRQSQESGREFTVNYLINSCSLSREEALSVSHVVTFKVPDKPDLVLAFFRKNGFRHDRIRSIILRHPKILLCSLEKNIMPKIEFFRSVGFSNEEIQRLLDSRIKPIARSLKSQIIPSFNLLRKSFPSNGDLISAILQCPEILTGKYPNLMLANIGILKEIGIPEPNIGKTLQKMPRVLEEMGVDTGTRIYVRCLRGLTVMSREIWDDKLAIYEQWGCSKGEVLEAFKKHSCYMTASADKIRSVMEFLVHEKGFNPSDVLKAPVVFSLSVKKRMIPRCLVFDFLVEKGLRSWFSGGKRIEELEGYRTEEITVVVREEVP